MEYNFSLLGIILVMFLINKSDSDAEQTNVWSEWQSCDKTCGGGFQFRARYCPNELNNCSTFESRRCNEFDCDKIPTTILTTKSSTTVHVSTNVRGESLMSSFSASPTSPPDLPEVSTEIKTTLLSKSTPKIVRSTKPTTTTTTSPPKLVANPRSGAVCLRSSTFCL
ncbi:uncharacterized protein LOC134263244 [Saccostrea cucullata]|uniref:uncharacterized protein LOC134256350 n=1 Tax=Saccostrea cuccullata TaxID=36930 RepID=UPI002ED3648F